MAANPSVKKREKERARAEKAREKDEKRKIRKAEADARPPGEEGVDPDLAGIVWGPQPVVVELSEETVFSMVPASVAQVCRAASCAGIVLLCAAKAAARCPDEAPAAPACVPLSSWALPTVHADLLFPRKARAEVYAGGGFDLSLISWSNNIDSFGPSQGAVRLGASYLRGGGGGSGRDERSLVTYRLSTVVSFEGNASRRFLIPTFGTAIGGLWEAHAKHVAAAEGLLGLYLFYTRHVVVDAQGGVLVPLSTSQALFGPKAQLTASFALW